MTDTPTPRPLVTVAGFVAYWTFDRLLMAWLFLVIIVACGLTPMQGDTWWQLRAGRDMWLSGRVLLTDVYSHTAYGNFWLNHEWLAEVLYYGVYRVGGLPGVTLFAAALIAGGWAMTWRLAGGATRWKFAWMLPALLPASLWWEPRPHAFSLLFLPTAVFVVAHRRYSWLPLIFIVWANCHGGVLLGLVVVAAGLGIQALMAPRSWWKPALTVAACAVAMTATPLGLSFWTEIPNSLARIHLYPLDEWRRTPLTDPHVLPFWILASTFCAAIFVRRRNLLRASTHELTVYTCSAVLLPMAIMSIRNVGPFLMIAVPALTLLIGVPRLAQPRRRPERYGLNLAMVMFGVAAVASTLTFAYRNKIPRLRWNPIPAPALAALQLCPDNLYNRYDEGGSLLWFLPERRVFLDGRQDPFSPELVLEHIGMETQGDDHRGVFARHNIRCAYLPTESPTVTRLDDAGWSSLYRGAHWVVLADYRPSANSPW
jgi:hypothetical protein